MSLTPPAWLGWYKDLGVLQIAIITLERQKEKKILHMPAARYPACLAATLTSHSAWSWLITGEAVHREVA